MGRITSFITGLILPAIAAMALASAAGAGSPGAAQALQILTRARVADERCHILSPAQHDELARYSARAELAAAQQLSASMASTAVRAGEAEGRAATCTETLRSDVNDTLTAARQAVQRADSGNFSAGQTAPAVPPAAASLAEVPRRPGGGLAVYADQLRPYYLERKCRLLSPNQDRRYWQAITRLHQATVAGRGYPAVRAAMHRAEVSAATRSCAGDALLAIKAGFAAAVGF